MERLRSHQYFYLSYLMLLFLGLVFYFYNERGDFVLMLNGLHNPILDFWFKYWTYTGTVPFFALITLSTIIYRKRTGLVLAIIGTTIGLVTFLFKRILFAQTLRPKAFFEGKYTLDFVEGVDMLSLYSFPSGHAMAAFGLSCYCSLIIRKKVTSFILIIGATMTAISRVYLAQHFLIDIMIGSMMGIFISSLLYILFEKYIGRGYVNEHSFLKESEDK